MAFTRRDFLGLGMAAGSYTVANDLRAFAAPLRGPRPKPGFDVLVFATNWGFSGGWDVFASRIKEAGYDGAEVWYPAKADERRALADAFTSRGLRLGFLVGGSARDFKKHLEDFRSALKGAVAEKPVYINCHSGRDYFSFEQNKKFIDETISISTASGVPVYHETHRARILYAAPVAKQYIQQIPGLRITLDISHWCNVHESLLEDQPETVALALNRADHIHARIGHAEGPQVNDPRAPEWKNAVQAHFQWWDAVVERKKKEGKVMTFLTEFGPADYMPALPYTRQPIANQWEINKFMLDTLRSRYR